MPQALRCETLAYSYLQSTPECENTSHLKHHELISRNKTVPISLSSNQIKCFFFYHCHEILTDQEKSVLIKGLNFSIPPTKVNYCGFGLLHYKPINLHYGLNLDFI